VVVGFKDTCIMAQNIKFPIARLNMASVVSYLDRGPFGDSKYPG